jgi:hypothetical protein
MHRYHDVTFVPPWMLVTIDSAPLLDQPFSKCCTFHCSAPVDKEPTNERSQYSSPQIVTLERIRCELAHRAADKGNPASAGKYNAQTCGYSG